MTAPKPAASTPQTAPKPTPPVPDNPPSEAKFYDAPAQAAPAMPDADREELEQYRAERAKREAVAGAATKADGTPNLDLDPVKQREAFLQLSVDDQIRAHYLHARGTIQDYARIFKLTVDEVLVILGFDDMSQIETIGDLIDQKELGPNATVKPHGQVAEANYSVN